MGIWAVIAALVTAAITFIGIVVGKENKISEFRQKWIDDLRNDIGTAITHSITIQGIASAISAVHRDIANAKRDIRHAQQMLQGLKIDAIQKTSTKDVINSDILKYEQQEKQASFELEELVKYLQKLFNDSRETYSLIMKSINLIRLRVNKDEKDFLKRLENFQSTFLELYFAVNQGKSNDMTEFLKSIEFKNFKEQGDLFLEESKELLKREWKVVKRGEKSFVEIKEQIYEVTEIVVNIASVFLFIYVILLTYDILDNKFKITERCLKIEIVTT